MWTTSVQRLVGLQQKPKNIRNICILAHVDHGKTTLADALVASNGIISQRMAGKLRYMDNREDEQERGITMKSSAISLFYQHAEEEILINLIDTPGHVDFSSEVSTAVRLCDGAIVVVDVVEGVCPQTHAVLRQAWLEKIKPILVLNKVDRLITELKMMPLEAYIHLQQTLEQVNVITSELFTSEIMQKTANSHDWTATLGDSDEMRDIFFSPDQGNVVFASAYDGWGFTIEHFARIVSEKLGINKDVLQKTLWGDYYISSKAQRILKGAQAKAKRPLFVQFILENIWTVYESVYMKRDMEIAEKIVNSLNLKISQRESHHRDGRVYLQAITSQWLPISPSILSVVVERLPSPLDISEDRVESLMCGASQSFHSLPNTTQHLKQAFLSCHSDDDRPVIVFVSKMYPVDKTALPQNRQRPLKEEEIRQRREQARQQHTNRQMDMGMQIIQTGDSETDGAASDKQNKNGLDVVFLAFARIFSGTIKKGQQLFVLGPKHDPSKALKEQAEGLTISTSLTLKDLPSIQHITSFVVENLYLLMGRELEAMEEIPAGNVLGIGGLEEHILKSATIASTVSCPTFTNLSIDAVPIVRVAIEPKQAGNMSSLVHGLRLLNQADPCVQVLVQETGEHVIITAGEVHLQRCIDDLTKRYAKVEINASDPIVPFRETIVPRPKVDMVNEVIQDLNQRVKSLCLNDFEDDAEVLGAGLVEMNTSNKNCQTIIHAIPLPETVTALLVENQHLLKTLHERCFESRLNNSTELNKLKVESLKEFKSKLQKTFRTSGKQWVGVINKIWAFGPRHVGPNLLLNGIDGYNRPNVWYVIEKEAQNDLAIQEYDNSIINGFQLATLAGPLCEEPMCGVCFSIEKWHYKVPLIPLFSVDSSDIDCLNPVVESSSIQKGPLNKIDICKCEQIEEGSLNITHTSNGDRVSDSCERNCELIDQDIPLINSSTYVSGDEEGMKSDMHCMKQSHECRVHHRNQNDQVFTAKADQNNFESEREIKHKNDFKVKKLETYGPFSGQLMSCIKDGCRKSFQTQSQRLMAAMYRCNIQATADVLGKLYGVLAKRNGHALSDEMREGTQVFNVVAVLPVVESFGFAEEIRKKTSGLASPQLVFSHWEVLDVDPFWVPTTEEEYLHFGVKADSANRARQYMNSVRKRKGLKVDEKIVEHAEKQRTLTKMK